MIETIYSDPNFLAHHGVKGMKWGVRKMQNTVVGGQGGKATGSARLAATAGQAFVNKKRSNKSTDEPKLTMAQRRVSADAKKDADEFARAKMFYGEGAGTRRKLIKNTVESKSKKDPFYASEFEKHLAAQDMGKRAAEAQQERKMKDLEATTVKTGKKVARAANSSVGRAVMGTLLSSL